MLLRKINWWSNKDIGDRKAASQNKTGIHAIGVYKALIHEIPIFNSTTENHVSIYLRISDFFHSLLLLVNVPVYHSKYPINFACESVLVLC